MSGLKATIASPYSSTGNWRYLTDAHIESIVFVLPAGQDIGGIRRGPRKTSWLLGNAVNVLKRDSVGAVG